MPQAARKDRNGGSGGPSANGRAGALALHLKPLILEGQGLGAPETFDMSAKPGGLQCGATVNMEVASLRQDMAEVCGAAHGRSPPSLGLGAPQTSLL